MKFSRFVCQIIIWMFFPLYALYGQKPSDLRYNAGHDFIKNEGQVHDQDFKARNDVLFICHAKGLSLALKKDGLSYLQISNVQNEIELGNLNLYRLDISFINSSSNVEIKGLSESDYYYNFYLTHIPNGVTKVRSFSKIKYNNLFQEIDMLYYKKNGNLEYDFICKPGSNIEDLRWKIDGAASIEINESGDMVISTTLGQIVEKAPFAHQDGHEIEANWVVDENIIGISVGAYDKSLPLTIDPVVRVWGTYFGSIYTERCHDSAIDDSNNVIISGYTLSPHSLATSGSYQTTLLGSTDGYLARMKSDGLLKWATYYGGPKTENKMYCSVDGMYNIYAAGRTNSDSAISTTGSHQQNYNDSTDVFLVKFNNSGIRLWATYFGGYSGEDIGDCQADNVGNVYLAGSTKSDSGIASTAAYRTTKLGLSDGFIAKFNNSGTRIWSTYFGGNLTDRFNHISVDNIGSIYACGWTNSNTNLSTSNSYQVNFGGSDDAFLVRFSENGMLKWSTYYGGTQNEEALYCTTDNISNIYVTGFTHSTNNIASTGTQQSTFAGGIGSDGFIAKFDSSGNRIWGTYYGGDSIDVVNGCDIDYNLDIYVTGYTGSSDSISTGGSYQVTFGGQTDAFLAKFNQTGKRIWGTYYGGQQNDLGMRCFVVPPTDYIYLIGETSTINYSVIATQGRHQYFKGGATDAFLVKFSQCENVEDTIYVFSCSRYHSPSGKIYYQTGTYLDSLSKEDGCDSLVTINLTISSLDTSVSVYGDSLVSNAKWAHYQWMNCDGAYKLMTNDTNVYFVAPYSGSYAVLVKEDSCQDTSSCFVVKKVGIQNYTILNEVSVFPNPFDNVVNIDLGSLRNVNLRVFDINKRLVYSEENISSKSHRFELNVAPGIYIVELDCQGLRERFKLVKN